jgi:hypothetical protein
LLYPHEKSLGYMLDRCLEGPKITLNVVEERDILKSRMKEWEGHVA